MKQNPCVSCKYFHSYDTGAMSCYGIRDPQFYWPNDQDKMMASCPLGWRAKKSGSGREFDYYRDYDKVHKLD